MEECDYFHLGLAFGASQRVHVVDFLDPQTNKPSARYFEAGGVGSSGSSSKSRGVVFFSFLVA